MNRNDSLSLWGAINSNSLKAKPIAPTTFNKYLGLKKDLREYINAMVEKENELAFAMQGIDRSDPIYQDKLKEIQKAEFTPKELNFFPEKELQWTEESTAEFALILTEHLLKKES